MHIDAAWAIKALESKALDASKRLGTAGSSAPAMMRTRAHPGRRDPHEHAGIDQE
jgi:hypothetical protein